MKRLVLLVLDGEGFRTPGLIQALETGGWDPVWCAGQDPEPSGLPDLALFDPTRVSREGVQMLRALRGREPRLPLMALGVPGEDPAWLDPAGLAPLARMERDADASAWPGILAGCLHSAAAAERKYTAEDLFGDILSDLEGTDALGGTFTPLPPTVPNLPEEGGQTRPGIPLPPAPPKPPPPMPAAPAAAPEEEGVLEQFGNYNLLEKVAVGGMAELFKARQRGVHNFEKIVAIKRILPHLSDNDEFVRMFIDEAKLAAQLSHPNIVQIYDLGKAGGFYYIAMEYVDGRDLRSLLRKVREYKLPVPEALAAAVIMKVASALDYAHRKRAIDDKELRLVHRDISPQNILISYDGAVKLVDFGIAKAATKNSQTQTGALKGKLLYMSPEQALGQPLDGRSDIYSLGLVLAELLTGERCFQADSELGVLEKVRLGRVVAVRAINPAISPEMGVILERLLQKDAEQRYASARLLERDLKTLLAGQGYDPSEQDLAEYVGTLLKGSREEVEALVARRFPPRQAAVPVAVAEPAIPPAQVPAVQVPAVQIPALQVPAAPVPDRTQEPAPALEATEVRPRPEAPARPARTMISAAAKPRPAGARPWLLALLGLAAILAAWVLLK